MILCLFKKENHKNISYKAKTKETNPQIIQNRNAHPNFPTIYMKLETKCGFRITSEASCYNLNKLSLLCEKSYYQEREKLSVFIWHH